MVRVGTLFLGCSLWADAADHVAGSRTNPACSREFGAIQSEVLAKAAMKTTKCGNPGAKNDASATILRLDLRIFLSSPSDVPEERRRARELIQRLNKDHLLKGRVNLEAVSWDDPDAPPSIPANLTPQQAVNRGLAKPSDCDIVVVLFWNRMGTELDRSEGIRANGEPYRSGTEWEFNDALNAPTQPARPVILLYRRTDFTPDASDPDDPKFKEQLDQRRKVNAFFQELLQKKRFSTKVTSADDFEKRLENDLECEIKLLLLAHEKRLGNDLKLQMNLLRHLLRLAEEVPPRDTAKEVALHQPGTLRVKRSSEAGNGETVEIPTPFHPDLIFQLHSEAGHCKLTLDDVDNGMEFVLASVRPGEWQEGLGEVTVIDHDAVGPGGGSLVKTIQLNRMVVTLKGAVIFHNLFVDNQGECHASFVAEYAADPRQLFDK